MAARVAPVTTPTFAPVAAPSLPPTIPPTTAPRTPPLTAPPRRCAKATEANIASATEVTPRIPNLVIVLFLFTNRFHCSGAGQRAQAGNGLPLLTTDYRTE